MTAESRYLTCAGYELHFMDWGPKDAEPVIAWHGLARTGRDFDLLAGALAGEYRVIAPDTVGRGLSQWAKDREHDYCFDVYGATAVALLDGLGLDRVRWVGTSMGGLIGITLAGGVLKDRISHLVINDVGPDIPEGAVERIAAYVGNPPIFDAVTEVETWLRTVYAPFGDNPDSFWRTMAESSCRRLPDGRVTAHYDPKIVTQFTAHKGDLDVWDRFLSITCPVLLLRGANSDVLPRATADAMADRHANCTLVEFAGFGHAPTLVAADQQAAIRNFLAG